MDDIQRKKILTAARALVGTSYRDLDCSHMVHRAYSEAGFAYGYVSTGFFPTPEFVGTTNPQPGDVVLFMGHMGIYDPQGCETVSSYQCKQNSGSMSLLSARSGLGKTDYGSLSWFKGNPSYWTWK